MTNENLTIQDAKWNRIRGWLPMSEAENCSIAILEAIFYKRPVVCSPIASHLEFLTKHGYSLTEFAPGCLDATPPSTFKVAVPTWAEISAETVSIMQEPWG